MTKNDLHHYVPCFLLRKFGLGKKDRLHVFDKQKNYAFVSSAKSVAAENGFYDFVFMGTDLTMEASLSKIESQAAAHLSDIENRRWLPHAGSEARVQLACFLAVQLVRTRAKLNAQADFKLRLERWLRQHGMDESYFEPDPAIGDGKNAEKAILAKQIANAPKDFAPAILEKEWFLLQASRQNPFIIGDSPLVMHNMIDRWPRGNLGLAVKGIEIYLPISPQLTLAMICPSHVADLKKGVESFKRLSHRPEAHNLFGNSVAHGLKIIEAIDGGNPLICSSENVEFHNSLQVIESERFVFSMQNDFSLVKEMLAADPQLSMGPRMTEATGKF